MPKMVLNRNYTLRTTTPWSVQFVKGEPTEVHPSIVPLALGIGAVMEDGSDGIPEEVKKEVVAPSGDDRKKLLFGFYEKLVLRNQRGDFTASGFPDLRVLNGLIGDFRIDRKEMEATWEEYQLSKNVTE